tara:strand:+ start:125 stop:724 length:600 start_codon:yes stop_codon:yes gene_type:complete
MTLLLNYQDIDVSNIYIYYSNKTIHTHFYKLIYSNKNIYLNNIDILIPNKQNYEEYNKFIQKIKCLEKEILQKYSFEKQIKYKFNSHFLHTLTENILHHFHSNEIIEDDEIKEESNEHYNEAIHLTINNSITNVNLSENNNKIDNSNDNLEVIQKEYQNSIEVQKENKKLYHVLRIIGIIETNMNINVSFKLHIFNNYI